MMRLSSYLSALLAQRMRWLKKDRQVGMGAMEEILNAAKDLDGVLATYNPDADYARKVKFVMRQIAPTMRNAKPVGITDARPHAAANDSSRIAR